MPSEKGKEYRNKEKDREYAKQYYWEHHDELLAKKKVSRRGKPQPQVANKAQIRFLRGFIQQQKAGCVCMRCGIDDPVYLIFIIWRAALKMEISPGQQLESGA